MCLERARKNDFYFGKVENINKSHFLVFPSKCRRNKCRTISISIEQVLNIESSVNMLVKNKSGGNSREWICDNISNYTNGFLWDTTINSFLFSGLEKKEFAGMWNCRKIAKKERFHLCSDLTTAQPHCKFHFLLFMSIFSPSTFYF